MKKSLALLVLGSLLSGPTAAAAEAHFHALFKPLRVTRVGELYQVELAVEVMNLLPAPTHARVFFLGSKGLAGGRQVPFGGARIAAGGQAELVTMVAVPESELLGWQRQDALPRLRIEHAGPAASGVEVIEAVPAGPPDPTVRSRVDGRPGGAP